MPPELRDSFQVRVSHGDADRRLALSALMGFFQEVAYDHAHALGLGMRELGAQQLAWVLHRIKVEVSRYPMIGETIDVRTWPTDLQRSLAYRDFAATDAGGAVVARGSSAWAVVSLAMRGAIRIPEWIASALTEPVAPQLAFEHRRVGKVKRVDLSKIFDVRRHDIDMLQHVNNVRYVEWATETVPDDVWRERRIRDLDVQFRAEAVFGDQISSETERIEADHFLHRLVRPRDGGELVVLRSRWM